MPAPTICTVSGTLVELDGSAMVGAVISVKNIKPFIHPSDNSLVVSYQASATTNSSGVFSLDVIETTTPAVSLQLTVQYSSGLQLPVVNTYYYVTIPNAASATLASLISGQ
jgi:hypothetical protein